MLKNSSGRVRVAKKSSGRVAGTRQSLAVTSISDGIFDIEVLPRCDANFNGKQMT